MYVMLTLLPWSLLLLLEQEYRLYCTLPLYTDQYRAVQCNGHYNTVHGNVVHWPVQCSVVHWPVQCSVVHWPVQCSVVHWPVQCSVVHWPVQCSKVHWPVQCSVVYWPVLFTELCKVEYNYYLAIDSFLPRIHQLQTVGALLCTIWIHCITLHSTGLLYFTELLYTALHSFAL